MKFIGITGGIGAGKSVIIQYLSEKPRVRVLNADEIAKELMEPGHACYEKLYRQFSGEGVFLKQGGFDREKLAKVIFSNSKKREKLNAIVHPAVKEYVNEQRRIENQKNELDYLFLEAALLVEENYGAICDELWYVYASRERRRERLKAQRGYTDEKIKSIFASQLGEQEYRNACDVTINNNGPLDDAYEQVERALKGNENMSKVFGLDIGTRNVVGTVGYRTEDEEFVVLAQHSRQHEKRAMLDGQIHDIGRVARTIGIVKTELERQIGEPLTEVCIAAAGRVLKTVTTHIEYEYPEEAVVTDEDIHTLDLLGIEKAQEILKQQNDTNYKFYCVGYSVVKYFLNDEVFISIEGHKASKVGEDLIVTFLPEDVVDGLYAAVGQVGLTVANMTLEPIAAINVAIPENYRMLNIALVDVGAGTSDISITRDGSIIAYGMIPEAGDELTEHLVQHYLVDFMTAERMKVSSTVDENITYKDIMSIEHTLPASEIWELLNPLVDRITTEVAGKIRELNGDRTVSACFVVGGGGKVHGYTEMLAEKLDLPNERVALRGEEVLQDVIFKQPDVRKDPLIVTPIGICMNYYGQKNNFIMVRFNGERMKLYDNNRLTIVDAALQAGFPNDQLFPKRGMPINFTVNGVTRIVRGEAGEPAIVTMNGEPANINTPLEPNCEITIEPSTAGDAASYTIGQLDEYTSSIITFQVNGQWISCPKFVEVNGRLEPATYQIHEGDAIETRNFYTVGQVAEFMDMLIEPDTQILVNNRPATADTLVYENFSIEWTADVGFAEGYSSFGYDVDFYARRQGEDGFTPEQGETFGQQEFEKNYPAPQLGSEGYSGQQGDEGYSSQPGYGKNHSEVQQDYGAQQGYGKGYPIRQPGYEEGYSSMQPGSRMGSYSQPVSQGANGYPYPAGAYAANGFGSQAAGPQAGAVNGGSPQTGAMNGGGLQAGAMNGGSPQAGAMNGGGLQTGAMNGGGSQAGAMNGGSLQAGAMNGGGSQAGAMNGGSPQAGAMNGGSPQAGTLQGDNSQEEEHFASGDEENIAGEYDPQEYDSDKYDSGDEAEESEDELAEENIDRSEYVRESASGFGPGHMPGMKEQEEPEAEETPQNIVVTVNGESVNMSGKSSYIFVDIFDRITFNLQAGGGRAIVTLVNGHEAQFSEEIHDGDKIELYWKEN